MNVPRPPSVTHRRKATGVDRQASAVSNDFFGAGGFRREARGPSANGGVDLVNDKHVMASTSPPTPEQVQLVQRLFLEHLDEIRGYAGALLPDRAAADDVVQEVFLAMTARADAYDIGRDFKAWAFGFARNKVLEAGRKVRKTARPLEADVLEILTAAKPDLTLPPAALAFLAECLGELAPKAREIVEHRYQKGLQPHEISSLIGWSRGSVRVALSRARTVLRKCLQRKLALAGDA